MLPGKEEARRREGKNEERTTDKRVPSCVPRFLPYGIIPDPGLQRAMIMHIRIDDSENAYRDVLVYSDGVERSHRGSFA